jgi:hypothetical protein
MGTAPAPNPSNRYQIRVKGLLDPQWSDWFDDFTITQIDGDSVLIGDVQDQAALHGVINKIRNLGLVLVLVEWID